jgi:hypothetical protein
VLHFVPDRDNNGAATLNVDQIGARAIKKPDGVGDPVASDLLAGQMYPLWFDGSAFRLTSSQSAGGTTNASALTTGTLANARLSPDVRVTTFGVTIDGGGNAIGSGENKGYVVADANCTITGWTLTAEPAGSISIEVDRRNNALPLVTADSITAAANASVSSAGYRRGTCPADCAGWGTAIAANDVLGFFVSSASIVSRATLSVFCQR